MTTMDLNKIQFDTNTTPEEAIRTIFNGMDENGFVVIPDLYYDNDSEDESVSSEEKYIRCKFNIKENEMVKFTEEFKDLYNCIKEIAKKTEGLSGCDDENKKNLSYELYSFWRRYLDPEDAKEPIKEDMYLVVRRMQRLCKLLEIGAPDIIIRNEARMAAEALMLHRYAESVEAA